jgi:hypothetical protein
MGIDSATLQAGPEKNEPFDPASLPSIDAITADTDIIAFLQSGVPAELTRAALRRAWTSDPAIRDFIGVAENQWDFNDPNGAPGFGPLGTIQGQVAFLSQVSPSLKKLPDLLAGEMILSRAIRSWFSSNSRRPIHVLTVCLVNCIPPVFHPPTSAKHLQKQRMRMPSDGTARPAAAGLMVTLCRDSAAHCRSWRLLNFGLPR